MTREGFFGFHQPFCLSLCIIQTVAFLKYGFLMRVWNSQPLTQPPCADEVGVGVIYVHRQVDVLADANGSKVVSKRWSEDSDTDGDRHVKWRLLGLHVVVDVRDSEGGDRRLADTDAKKAHSQNNQHD